MIPGETALWGYPAVVVLKDTYGEFEVLDGIRASAALPPPSSERRQP